jgi:hypothetical protein
MLWVWVATLFGIFRFRGPAYWKWVGILIVWLLAASLFRAGGTLEDPSGDGLITHQVRVMTNNGAGVALLGILFLIAFYGGIIFIARKLWEIGKEIEYGVLERGWEGDASVPLGRKLVEAVSVTLVAGAWAYVFMVLPATNARQPVPAAADSITPKVSSAPEPQDTVALELAASAAELNRDAPKKIDEITTLTSVTSAGRFLQYNYRISEKGSDIEQLRTSLRKNIVSLACKDFDAKRQMKEFGIAYRYIYELPDHKEPLIIIAAHAECLALGLD